MFQGYFVEGADLGDRETLVRLAESCGLASSATQTFLESNDGLSEVAQASTRARESGISGVPTFILNGTSAITGAQSADLLSAAFLRALAFNENSGTRMKAPALD